MDMHIVSTLIQVIVYLQHKPSPKSLHLPKSQASFNKLACYLSYQHSSKTYAYKLSSCVAERGGLKYRSMHGCRVAMSG